MVATQLGTHGLPSSLGKSLLVKMYCMLISTYLELQVAVVRAIILSLALVRVSRTPFGKASGRTICPINRA